MANICTNILVLTNMDEVLTDKFIEEMKGKFDCYYVDKGETEVEIGFASQFCFPAEELKQMTGNIKEPETYIDVLSYDFSVNYARYHQFSNCQWNDMWQAGTT